MLFRLTADYSPEADHREQRFQNVFVKTAIDQGCSMKPICIMVLGIVLFWETSLYDRPIQSTSAWSSHWLIRIPFSRAE